MAREKLTDAQIERIKAVYAETGNKSEAARAAGVSRTSALRYITADAQMDSLRQQKRVEAIATVARERADFAELLADAREAYIRHLMEPTVIATADAKDAATIVGILTDKHQLVTGAATARTEASIDITSLAAAADQKLSAFLDARRVAPVLGQPDASREGAA